MKCNKVKRIKGISMCLAMLMLLTGNVNAISKDNVFMKEIKQTLEKKDDYFKTKSNGFRDMGKHWSDITVGKLVELKAISGYQDGTFKPNNTVTRAEFCVMISKLFKLKSDNEIGFEDSKDHWAKESIESLLENKVIDKNEYGSKYEPNKNITRIEMAKMLVRAMELDKEAIEKNKNTSFADDKNIPQKDKGYVIVAVEKGLIKGYPDNSFKPNGEATRAEASTMIINMLHTMTGVKQVVKPVTPVVSEGVNKAEYLPKVSFEQEGLNQNVKDMISKKMDNRSVGEIIKGDVNQFPLEFGNVVITGIERIPYNSSSPFYKLAGWETDAIVVHGYPLKDNDKNGIVKGYSLKSLKLGMVSKNGEFINTSNVSFEDKNVINKLKQKYPNILEGDFARANVGQNFSVIYLNPEGFSINNLKKLIIQDAYFSTNDVLEFDMSQIK